MKEQVTQVKPLTVKRCREYIREWSGYRSVQAVTDKHDKQHFYFTAKDDSRGLPVELRVDRTGHVVGGTRYHDIASRPILTDEQREMVEVAFQHAVPADGWENVDAIGCDTE